MKQLIQLGTTSKMISIFVQSVLSTTGGGLTGLTNSSAGLTWYWFAEDSTADAQVTLATMTLGTWASGGFIQVDSTNMPGVYEIGIPNAITTNTTTTRSWAVMYLQGAANMVPVTVEIQFTGWNPSSTNVAANVNQWLGTAVTSNAGVPITTNTGTVTATVPTLSTNVNVQQWLGTAVTSNAGTPIVYATNTVSATVVGTPTVNVVQWDSEAVVAPNVSGVPIVDVGDWNGTAVTSHAGIPIVYPNGGTIATVTGTVAAVTTASSVGTVTNVGSATVVGTPTVNVVDWLGTAVTSNAGVPLVDVAAGTINTVTGTVTATVPSQVNANVQDWLGTAVTSSGGTPIVVATNTVNANVVDWLGTAVTSAAGVPVTTNLGTVTATVPTLSTNVNVQQWLGTAVTSNAGVPLVDVAAGTINTVTGTVTATVPAFTTNVNVVDWLGTAVTSAAGVPVTTNLGTITATVPTPVSITSGQLTIKKDQALNGFSFPMYNSTTGALMTGLTVASVVSKDGGSPASTTNSVSEIGSGLYSLNLAAADTNGTVLTFIFTATGAAASVITVVTQA